VNLYWIISRSDNLL